MHTEWKNVKFSLTNFVFREINSLSTYLAQNVGFTKFLSVWKLREFSLTHFWQIFRESKGFTK